MKRKLLSLSVIFMMLIASCAFSVQAETVYTLQNAVYLSKSIQLTFDNDIVNKDTFYVSLSRGDEKLTTAHSVSNDLKTLIITPEVSLELDSRYHLVVTYDECVGDPTGDTAVILYNKYITLSKVFEDDFESYNSSADLTSDYVMQTADTATTKKEIDTNIVTLDSSNPQDKSMKIVGSDNGYYVRIRNESLANKAHTWTVEYDATNAKSGVLGFHSDYTQMNYNYATEFFVATDGNCCFRPIYFARDYYGVLGVTDAKTSMAFNMVDNDGNDNDKFEFYLNNNKIMNVVKGTLTTYRANGTVLNNKTGTGTEGYGTAYCDNTFGFKSSNGTNVSIDNIKAYTVDIIDAENIPEFEISDYSVLTGSITLNFSYPLSSAAVDSVSISKGTNEFDKTIRLINDDKTMIITLTNKMSLGTAYKLNLSNVTDILGRTIEKSVKYITLTKIFEDDFESYNSSADLTSDYVMQTDQTATTKKEIDTNIVTLDSSNPQDKSMKIVGSDNGYYVRIRNESLAKKAHTWTIEYDATNAKSGALGFHADYTQMSYNYPTEFFVATDGNCSFKPIYFPRDYYGVLGVTDAKTSMAFNMVDNDGNDNDKFEFYLNNNKIMNVVKGTLTTYRANGTVLNNKTGTGTEGYGTAYCDNTFGFKTCNGTNVSIDNIKAYTVDILEEEDITDFELNDYTVLTGSITLNFSYPLSGAAVDNVSITSAGNEISKTVRFKNDNKTIVVTPANKLSLNSTYKLDLSNVTDVLDRKIENPVKYIKLSKIFEDDFESYSSSGDLAANYQMRSNLDNWNSKEINTDIVTLDTSNPQDKSMKIVGSDDNYFVRVRAAALAKKAHTWTLEYDATNSKSGSLGVHSDYTLMSTNYATDFNVATDGNCRFRPIYFGVAYYGVLGVTDAKTNMAFNMIDNDGNDNDKFEFILNNNKVVNVVKGAFTTYRADGTEIETKTGTGATGYGTEFCDNTFGFKTSNGKNVSIDNIKAYTVDEIYPDTSAEFAISNVSVLKDNIKIQTSCILDNVNEGAVTLTADGTPVDFSTDILGDSGKTLTVTPNGGFDYDKNYCFTITSLLDLAGRTVAFEKNFRLHEIFTDDFESYVTDGNADQSKFANNWGLFANNGYSKEIGDVVKTGEDATNYGSAVSEVVKTDGNVRLQLNSTCIETMPSEQYPSTFYTAPKKVADFIEGDYITEFDTVGIKDNGCYLGVIARQALSDMNSFFPLNYKTTLYDSVVSKGFGGDNTWGANANIQAVGKTNVKLVSTEDNNLAIYHNDTLRYKKPVANLRNYTAIGFTRGHLAGDTYNKIYIDNIRVYNVINLDDKVSVFVGQKFAIDNNLELSGSFDICNYTSDLINNVQLVTVAYNKDHKISGIKFTPVESVSSLGTINVPYTIDSLNSVDISTVRAFLWDSADNMIPLALTINDR